MSNRKISALPDGVPAENADIIPAVRAGSNVRVTAESIADLATGGGGGGDPWASYGTPTWRYDFNTSADLTDWTEILNAFSGINFRPTGGMYTTTSTTVAGARSIANAPFVFDLRARYGRPGVAGTSIGLVVTGNAATDRRFVFDFRIAGSEYGTMSTQGNRRANFTLNTNTWNVDAGLGLWGAASNGITMRCYYDGTSYRFFASYGNPKQVDQWAAAFVEAKSSWLGDPVSVGFIVSAANDNTVCEFAQFQNTNLDKWAGE
jgi:hypothetical protein